VRPFWRIRSVSPDVQSSAAFCIILVWLGLAVLLAFYFMLGSVSSDDVLKTVANMQLNPRQSIAEFSGQ
jgi:hypothetical protein